MNKITVCGVEITNPEKNIDKKIKKIDLIEYYRKIAPFILPYIKTRPLSEIRCHNKFNDCFFKKHPNATNQLIYIKTKKELIIEAQLGSIEFHTYGCNSENLNKPNMMVFDFDPDEKISHKKIADCVMKVKILLDSLKLESFLKTSGGKGYHIVVPFKSSKNWKDFEGFAKNIADILEKKYPNLFTTNIRKSERKGKIFVDYLRNKKGATCVAPYSLRARENLTVSLPINWNDIYKIRPNQVTIKNVDRYLSKDVWKKFFRIKQNLN